MHLFQIFLQVESVKPLVVDLEIVRSSQVVVAYSVSILKFEELRVLQASLNVEGERQVVEHVLLQGVIVILHVQVKSLFVVHVEVVFYFVVKLLLVELEIFVKVVSHYRLLLILLLFVRFVLQRVFGGVLHP